MAFSFRKQATRRRLILLSIVFSGVACVLWLIFLARERELRTRTAFVMRVCVDGVREHDGNHLMPAVFRDDRGNMLYSWRFRIIKTQYGFPQNADWTAEWDAASNSEYRSLPPDAIPLCDSGKATLEPFVFAVTGAGTAFGVADPEELDTLEPDVILFVAVSNSNIHWMAPGDWNVDGDLSSVGSSCIIGGQHAGGFHVAFADGAVWFLSDKVPFEVGRQFFTLDGARRCDRDSLLSQYAIERWE